MESTRRGVMGLIVSIMAGAGCYEVQQSRTGRASPMGIMGIGSSIFEDLRVLEIERNETVRIETDDGELTQGILWEPDGVLEVEPEAELELIEIEL